MSTDSMGNRNRSDEGIRHDEWWNVSMNNRTSSTLRQNYHLVSFVASSFA